MAYIILPSRRTRQPQGAVRVDWSNPLTRGLTNLLGMYGGTMRQFALDATVPALYGSLPQYLLADGSVGLYNSESVASGTVNNYIELPVITSSAISVLVHGARFATPVGGQVAVIAATRAGGEVSGWEMAAGNSYGNSNLFYFTPLNVGSNPAFFSNGRKNSGNNPSDTSVENGKTYTVLGSFSAHTIGSGHSILAKASGASDYCEPNAVSLYATWSRQLSDNESVDLTRNPWQLFAPDPRRLWFAPSGGGATIITSSGAASLLAKAAAAVAATKTTTTVARSAVAGTAATTSIRIGAATAKTTSAGAASTTTIRTATIAARATGNGTAAATTLRTGLAAGRLTGSAETTYAAIVSGTFAAAGRTPARGTAAYTSTHAATAAATAATSGTATATTLRTGIAAARLDARAAVTAAALVAGTVTTSAAAQIGARASVTNSTERIAAVAAMLALRGATPAAPELPVIVPPSTRTLSPDHTRLGLSPAAPAKPRLG